MHTGASLLRYPRFVAGFYGNLGRFRLICDSRVFSDSDNGAVLLFFILLRREGLPAPFVVLIVVV